MANDEKLCYTIAEAAAILRISRNLCYQLARRGELPGAIKLGKRIVVSRVQLERLLDGNEKADNGKTTT